MPLCPGLQTRSMAGLSTIIKSPCTLYCRHENHDGESDFFDFKWVLKAKHINCHRLLDTQSVNHFARSFTCLTTKVGLLAVRVLCDAMCDVCYMPIAQSHAPQPAHQGACKLACNHLCLCVGSLVCAPFRSSCVEFDSTNEQFARTQTVQPCLPVSCRHYKTFIGHTRSQCTASIREPTTYQLRQTSSSSRLTLSGLQQQPFSGYCCVIEASIPCAFHLQKWPRLPWMSAVHGWHTCGAPPR